MTISAVVATAARYVVFGNMMFFRLHVSFTTAGAADPGVVVSFPYTFPSATFTPALVVDGASISGTGVQDIAENTQNLYFRRYDGANWGIGAGKQIRAAGFLEVVEFVDLTQNLPHAPGGN
jgi:hypothetical protein